MDEPVKKHEMTPDHHDNIVHDEGYQKKATDSILGTIAIVMGLFTVMASFLPYYGWLCFLTGAVGLGLGIYAVIGSKKHGYSASKGWIGIALSIAGMAFFIIQHIVLSTQNM